MKKPKNNKERYHLEAAQSYLGLVYRELMSAGEPSLAMRIKAIKGETEWEVGLGAERR